MSKNLKRLLSLVLALCMALSLGVTGFAEDGGNGTIAPVSEEDQTEPAPAQTGEGTALEYHELDPATLSVPKLGQEEESEGRIALLDDEDAVDLDEVVRVLIFLDDACALDAGYTVQTARAAGSYRSALRARQDAMTARIEGVIGHELNVHWNLTLMVNAVSADLTLGEMEKVAAIPGVTAVQRENRYLPMEGTAEPDTGSTSENMVGAQAAWAAGYTGAGSRVAIIDTGIDPNHQSFNADAFNKAIEEDRAAGTTVNLMTVDDIAAVLSQLHAKERMTSVTAAQLNSNGDKIVYGFNYIDGDTRIDHQDGGGNHGSHVAGIAAANRYIKNGSNYVDPADDSNALGAVGMAPDAQLLIMKVFSDDGAYDSDYMVAIEDAIVLGADVVNLSLGSAAPGFTFATGSTEGLSFQGILNKLSGPDNEKLVVSISAGNSYNAVSFVDNKLLYAEDVNMHTGGSPGSFINSLCVAAAQNTLTTGMPLKFNGSQKVFYTESTEDDDGNAYGNPAISTIAGTYDYVYIDAIGLPEDYAAVNGAVSLSGKIVIVNRGGIPFTDKGNNAVSYSPKGVVVANNDDGSFGMVLTGFTGTFPMVSIMLKDAEKIKANSASATAGGITYYTGSVEVTATEESLLIDRSEAEITDFSSWGVPGSLLMKPEITAPGGDIWSVYGTSQADSGSSTTTYASFSGTSMAAPHIAGLTGVLAQYLRENPIGNSALERTYNTRAIAQSLMMSTATPMKPGGAYLPILQQGAGLADVYRAINAKSVVMMSTADDTLTARTGAAADGKVKAEFGDDPEREGVYSYAFTLYNLTDTPQVYTIDTDLFTQALKNGSDGLLCMSKSTEGLDARVTYSWVPSEPVTGESHDVDMDGDTDKDDAQAILDWLTGYYDEVEDLEAVLDLSAADLDGDGEVTSYDAYLLLGWEDSPLSGYVLPAMGSAFVTVTVTLSDEEKENLDEDYAGGAYVQGFTVLKTGTATREGEDLGTEHSIPLLGFYGSWTDATMFDTTSYAQDLYDTENGRTPQTPYSGNVSTNYLRIQKDGTRSIFSGNPYTVEEEFPVDRLAISSDTVMLDIGYNLVRSAGTTGFAVSKVDAQGCVTQVLRAAITGQNVTGLYYHVNDGSWQNTTTKIYSINKTPADYGLEQGDLFRVGYYAIPEYYAMADLKPDNIASDSGYLTSTDAFETLLEGNKLGRGAFVGYDFVVDDTAPQLGTPSLSGNDLTVTASDDENLAYVAILSLDGSVKYAEAAPGSSQYSITFDASDAIANAQGYVAVFAGDYAGNEAAWAVKVNDNTHVEKTVYVLTNTLTAGEKYLVVDRNTAGAGHGLAYTPPTSQNATTANVLVFSPNVQAGTSETNGQPYIEAADAASTGIWTAASGITLSSVNGTKTWYMGRSGNNNLTINTSPSNRNWSYDGTNSRLTNGTRYLRYYNNTFSLYTSTIYKIYLYVETTISYDVDPYSVSSVAMTPATLDLYRGDSADLTAKVVPLTARDRSVSWTSSNEAIATVDAFGHVTAVAAGTATIRATSNADETKFAECEVTVTAINKELSAVVWDDTGDVFFSYFNANNLPTWTKRHNTGTGVYLTSAMMASSSALYACTNDLSSSTMYTVNRSTYALTQTGECYVPPFGMATVGTGFGGTGYFVFAFAKYILFGNLQPETDEDYGTYIGFPYGLLDLSETDVGDAYAVAICCREKGTTAAGYYFLDENGKIWQTDQTYSQSSGISFSAPTLVYDTGISAGLQYNSIYYDGTNLYWTRRNDNVAELVILANANNSNNRKLYRAGSFGEDVWPVAGLYTNGSLAPASVGDETEETLTEPLQLQIVATREELMTQDVIERFAAAGINIAPAEDADEPGIELVDGPIIEPADPIEIPIDDPVIQPVEETDGTEPVFGSLHAIRGAVRRAIEQVTDEPDAAVGGDYGEEGQTQVTIPVKESEASHNGKIAFAYDLDTLTYTGSEVNEDLSAVSVFVDDDKGVITIAYANRVDGTENDLIPAGTSIVDLHFTVGCEKALGEMMTMERNDELELGENEDVVIAGAGHLWGEPVWDWAEDYSSATATFTCQRDSEHTETLDAEITSETANGVITYTAAVEFEEEEYTDVQTVQLGVTVTFDLNTDDETASVNPTSILVVPGQPVGTLPVPTRGGGWKFLGWYTEPASGTDVTQVGDKVEATDAFSEDTTFFAHWRLPGDVNGDGRVDTGDVVRLAQYVKADCIGVIIVPNSADVNGDGRVDTADVVRLAQYVKADGNGVVVN